jgi:hypothetical protein
LRETLLDLEAYTPAIANYDQDAVLLRLAAIAPGELRTLPFKLRPGGESLHQLVAVLQPYAAALTSLDLAQRAEADLHAMLARKDHLVAQQADDIAVLRHHLGQLRWRCGEVGVSWRERWDGALAVLQQLDGAELGRLATLADLSAGSLQQLTAGNTLDIWHYQAWLHESRSLRVHPYWDALEQLRHIQAELLRTARARYKRRTSVLSSTVVYQQLRQRIRDLALEIGHDQAFDQ